MTTTHWNLRSTDGQLLVHTGVAGRAASLGHRLTIAMRQWQAAVTWADDTPTAAELVVDVDSFEVLHGAGGVKGLSGPEKALVRSSALKTLGAKHFPHVCFTADSIDQTADGYQLRGTVQIHGKSQAQVVDLHTEDLGDSWRMSCQCTVRQSDFGVKPYSLFMGSLQVADEVTVSFTASRTKDS